MCTVTFLPVNNSVYITSNRDEKSTRGRATPPDIYKANDKKLLYPADADKGGTWIVSTPNGDTGVLLNGALHAHISRPPYTESRGILLVRILQQPDPLQYFSAVNLEGIEPFTLILYLSGQLNECRWDEQLKSIVKLSATEPHIWSSSTLYSSEIIQTRAQLFFDWLKCHANVSQNDIFHFHTFGGTGDKANDFLMNRSGETLTVSITSVEIKKKSVCMKYNDLLAGKQYRYDLSEKSNKYITASNEWLTRLFIRIRNWEYWPFQVLYIPVYFYWFWICLKARSLFFFSAANPSIRNGGFLMESKKEIYDLLPNGTYPATILILKGTSIQDVKQEIGNENLQFPLIAKPDIGLRGMAVALLESESDLEEYHFNSKVDFLIQRYVEYTSEVGIFYYRLPGEKQGHITGMVAKELLQIIGDGQHSLLQLLQQHKRFLLQIPALTCQLKTGISEVLADGEKRLIVPFGNHSRGAKFLDVSDCLNDQLFNIIDGICQQVKGFYFGRLDIKYNNWEELCLGKNFSIIELNGAGSEPAHIYDPKHSVFFAWKEIIRHLDLLYKVSTRNRQIKKTPYLTVKQGLKMFRDNKTQVENIA